MWQHGCYFILSHKDGVLASKMQKRSSKKEMLAVVKSVTVAV